MSYAKPLSTFLIPRLLQLQGEARVNPFILHASYMRYFIANFKIL